MILEEWENLTLNICGISDDSIVDGPGLRYTIFVQGCPHGCPGCHNPQTHPFSGGKVMRLGDIVSQISENPLLSGVTFSGGEPFCQPGPLSKLGNALRESGYDIITYTGYTYDELLDMSQKDDDITKLLEVTDILVDGPFLIEQRDLELLFRGSRNQRLIDLAAMRQRGNTKDIIQWQPGSD